MSRDAPPIRVALLHPDDAGYGEALQRCESTALVANVGEQTTEPWADPAPLWLRTIWPYLSEAGVDAVVVGGPDQLRAALDVTGDSACSVLCAAPSYDDLVVAASHPGPAHVSVLLERESRVCAAPMQELVSASRELGPQLALDVRVRVRAESPDPDVFEVLPSVLSLLREITGAKVVTCEGSRGEAPGMLDSVTAWLMLEKPHGGRDACRVPVRVAAVWEPRASSVRGTDWSVFVQGGLGAITRRFSLVDVEARRPSHDVLRRFVWAVRRGERWSSVAHHRDDEAALMALRRALVSGGRESGEGREVPLARLLVDPREDRPGRLF